MAGAFRCFCELGDLAGAGALLRDTRRHIHRHPELSYREEATSALVAEKLSGWGWDVT
jgi:hippurate hydrolase